MEVSVETIHRNQYLRSQHQVLFGLSLIWQAFQKAVFSLIHKHCSRSLIRMGKFDELYSNQFYLHVFSTIYSFLRSTIYHFDPTNLPQCNKLQIVATSPTSTTPTTSSPNCPTNEAAQNRNKCMPKPNTVRESDDDDGGGGGDVGCGSPNVNCDNDGSSSDVIRNNSNPEIEISSLPCNESDNTGGASDKPTTDTVNTLLAPIEQIHAENYTNSSADNESDGEY